MAEVEEAETEAGETGGGGNGMIEYEEDVVGAGVIILVAYWNEENISNEKTLFIDMALDALQVTFVLGFDFGFMVPGFIAKIEVLIGFLI